MQMDKVRVAVVQTDLNETGPEANMGKALAYLKEAARKRAQIVCFPETYPGPWKKPLDFSPQEELARAARENNIYIIYGTAEKDEREEDRENIVEVILTPEGKVLGKYRRTSPPGPWIYKNSRLWDLDYKEADELPVFETEFGTIGILVCSEVYLPEISRILALKGAEIVFMPAGINKAELFDTWRLLIQARAIENLMYTTTCQNLLGAEAGLAMVASPEKILAESWEEGVVVADLDLDRIRQMRQTSDVYSLPLPYRTKPGVLDEWRRVGLYKKLMK